MSELPALIHDVFSGAAAMAGAVPRTAILMMTVGAIALGVLGMRLSDRGKSQGGTYSRAALAVLALIFVLVVAKFNHLGDEVSEIAYGHVRGAQRVSGGEVVLKKARDGHFWVTAAIGDKNVDFLIDTGATYTSLSDAQAREIGVTAAPEYGVVTVSTANGDIEARGGVIAQLSFGNIAVRNLRVLIAPNFGDINVLGMNFLSSLKSWRVEGDNMILAPKAE